MTSAEFQQLYGYKKVLHETKVERKIQDDQLKRDKAKSLGRSIQGKEGSVERTRVRFTGYRVRPLDPDNFAGSVKDLLDGLRHAELILGDEPWRIILETEQVKVASFEEEKTVIEIETEELTLMNTPKTFTDAPYPPAPERFAMGDNRRFHWRIYGSENGQRYEVYSIGLEQWAECLTPDHAKAVADALEALYERNDDKIQVKPA